MTPAQKSDARLMLGCCWPVRKVARKFGLSERELREELGLPIFEPETKPTAKPWDGEPTLFDE